MLLVLLTCVVAVYSVVDVCCWSVFVFSPYVHCTMYMSAFLAIKVINALRTKICKAL